MSKSRIFNGADAVLKIGDQKIASTKNITFSTDMNYLEPVIRNFLDLLARTGSSPAAEYLADREPVYVTSTMGGWGVPRQPGETDDELRKRLKK